MTFDERRNTFMELSPFDVTISRYMCDILDVMGFFSAPASTKYHGCYEGGLFEHSIDVFKQLEQLTKHCGLEWQRNESPFVNGLFHDLCKADNYEKTETGYLYNGNCLFAGHGDKSLIRCLELPICLTKEETACIRYHMGAFTVREEWQSYTNAIHHHPNVLWAHTADMMATHITEYEQKKVKPI